MAGVSPGLKTAVPMPKPAAPTLTYSPMLPGSTPPTGKTGMSFGKIAFSAFRPLAPASSAGNSFSASAPASMALNASVAVKKAGNEIMPSALARRMTSGLALGEMQIWPPTLFSVSTSDTFSTVPAPTMACSP